MAARKLVIAGIAGAVAATAGPVRADNLDLDAVVASIDAGDAAEVIARLRPQVDQLDAPGRCALGLAYAAGKKPDRTRGLIYLPSCGGGLPTAIAERAATIQARLAALAERAGDSRVAIITGGATVAVAIDRMPGDVVLAPATVWLAAGEYRLTATLPDGSALQSDVTVERRKEAAVLFELPKTAGAPAAPRPGKADFTDGEPDAATTYVGPPPKTQHKSLLGEKYLKGLEANAAARDRDIPVELPRGLNRRTVGVRIGAAVVDSSVGASIATTFAAIGRQPLTERLALDGRIDVMRRGPHMSDGTPGVWVGGLGGFARWWLVMGESTGVSLVAGVRAEVRHVFDGATDFGATVDAGVALDVFDDRFVIELRGEQGVNELEGARTRAVLIDVGMDL